jgi:hypothetical protein
VMLTVFKVTRTEYLGLTETHYGLVLWRRFNTSETSLGKFGF